MLELAGFTLIVAGLVDMTQSVLVPRGGGGFLTSWLLRRETALFAQISQNLGQPRLRRLSGPTLTVSVLACWFGLVWIGLALVCWPMLGGAVQASNGPTPRSFTTALYQAGFNLTTLGTGDLVPKSPAARMLTVFSSATGFALLTLSLSYITSVYQAVRERCDLAEQLDLRTGRTGEPRDLLLYWAVQSDVQDPRTILDRIVSYRQAHEFYPILHGVLFDDGRFSMQRIIAVPDEAAALGCAILPSLHRADNCSERSRALESTLKLLHSELTSLRRSFDFPAPAATTESLTALSETEFQKTADGLRNALAGDLPQSGSSDTSTDWAAEFASYQSLRS